jgi:hypothetical protein
MLYGRAHQLSSRPGIIGKDLESRDSSAGSAQLLVSIQPSGSPIHAVQIIQSKDVAFRDLLGTAPGMVCPDNCR